MNHCKKQSSEILIGASEPRFVCMSLHCDMGPASKLTTLGHPGTFITVPKQPSADAVLGIRCCAIRTESRCHATFMAPVLGEPAQELGSAARSLISPKPTLFERLGLASYAGRRSTSCIVTDGKWSCNML